jgi:hypothetical protein
MQWNHRSTGWAIENFRLVAFLENGKSPPNDYLLLGVCLGW